MQENLQKYNLNEYRTSGVLTGGIKGIYPPMRTRAECKKIYFIFFPFLFFLISLIERHEFKYLSTLCALSIENPERRFIFFDDWRFYVVVWKWDEPKSSKSAYLDHSREYSTVPRLPRRHAFSCTLGFRSHFACDSSDGICLGLVCLFYVRRATSRFVITIVRRTVPT